jgi:hypothetical protein
MTAASDWLEAEWMKYAFTTESMGTRPAAWYIALHTADPGETGATGETTYTNYARVSVASGWTRTDNQVVNASAVTFAANGSASSVTITHVSVWTASSGGNCLYKGALDLAKTFAQNDVPSFGVGELILKVD